MRNERGTLRAKTDYDTPPSTGHEVAQFTLGPFTVTAQPNHYEVYTRYAMFADGVLVREQISYPEEEDGWQGLSFCKANHTLTDEQLEVLKNFGRPTSYDTKEAEND